MPIVNRHIHLPECAQSSEDAASYPRAVQSLRGRENLDPHVLHGQSLDLVQQSVAETLDHR